MDARTPVEVSRLLDARGLAPLHLVLLAWSLVLAVIDGYDIAAIAFAAPSLVKAWGLTPGDLGPVLSASLAGTLAGAALFGWIGDRWGRRIALIAANLLFGVFTLAAAAATGPGQMFWLRLLAGLGIGGVIPNVVALNAECAPARLRATLAMIAVAGVTLGGAVPGVVAGFVVPLYGWQSLFVIGGAIPLLAGAAALAGLPESIKFMALHEHHHPRLVKLLASLDPGITIPAHPRFVIAGEKQVPGFSPRHLFGDGLAVVTPLTWLLFALNLMGYFFVLSWTPTLLAAARLAPGDAALAGTALQLGGTAGSLALSAFLQRTRFVGVAILFVLAVPAVGAIGWAGLTSRTALLITTAIAGFLVLGIQSGLNVLGAMIYPTSLRANGSGWQLGIGRLGSLAGPLAGSLLAGVAVEVQYVWWALPFAAGAVVSAAIHRLAGDRLRAVS